MISGTITSAREGILILTVFDQQGQKHRIKAVIDTGFDGWLTLPPSFIATLSLLTKRTGQAILADGSMILTNIYEMTVEWDEQEIRLAVDEVNAMPLVGMSLMYGYELIMPILDGATFTLKSIDNR